MYERSWGSLPVKLRLARARSSAPSWYQARPANHVLEHRMLTVTVSPAAVGSIIVDLPTMDMTDK